MIDISNYSTGVYFVKIKLKGIDDIVYKKIIYNK